VDGLSAKARADLGGGRDRLAVLADGELGPRLDPKLGDGPQISFERALAQKEIVYFHIDADRYPAASKLLGAALVIDLVTLVAQMQGSDMRGLLVIDEFAALAADQVSRLFGRARSAGLSVLLGTQGLADLRTARPEDPTDSLTEQVLTNASGFSGVDGIFRFRADGTNERGLAVLRVTTSGGQVISPAPKAFGGSGT